jgi:hypothetical protein
VIRPPLLLPAEQSFDTLPMPIVQRLPADLWVGTAVFAVAMVVGVLYCAAYDRTRPAPEPWVKELGAAIAFACGQGFVDPGYTPSPAIAAFLDKKIDRITCADLPANTPTRPPNFTQALYRYMTVAVAGAWKLFGISWASVDVLLGLLYGVTALAIYGLFRLATTRAAALTGAVIMTLSPLQLRYLPQLRDYAKAPFLLTLMLILGLLVVRPFTRRRLLMLATCYGVVTGIGFGFRNDLLIAALPLVVTVLAFLPAPLGAHVGTKLAAVALCALSFLVCAWPIVNAYRSGSNSGHVALLGLMTYFNKPLGITGSVYDWGAPYDDGYAVKVISSFSERVHHRRLTPLSHEYDRAMVEYLLLIARHWPADIVIRAYASVLRVLELPFQVRAYTTDAPPALVETGIGRLYAVWVGLFARLSGFGTVVTTIAMFAVASGSLRVATWLLLSLLYFGGYPALQFDARHFFFLEFVPWLALVSLCAAVWGAISQRGPVRGGGASATRMDGRLQRGLAFGLLLLVVVAGPLLVLRAYQQRHVAALVDGYLETTADSLTLSPSSREGGRVLLRPSELAQSTEPEIRAEYLIADIMRVHCRETVLPLTVRYVTLTGYTDLSQRIDVVVPSLDEPSRVFFPVYYSPGGYFAGIELPDADRGCLGGLRRVTDIDRTPILLTLSLPPDWRRMKLYQTLTARGPRIWSRG